VFQTFDASESVIHRVRRSLVGYYTMRLHSAITEIYYFMNNNS